MAFFSLGPARRGLLLHFGKLPPAGNKAERVSLQEKERGLRKNMIVVIGKAECARHPASRYLAVLPIGEG